MELINTIAVASRLKHFIEFFLFLVICGILYVAWICLEAFVEVKGQPREDMWLCDVHGTISKRHLIYFIGMPYCPLCFHNRLSSAEKIDK